MREAQANKTAEMIKEYLSKYPMRPIPQKGRPTYYRHRNPKDNELDVNKTIRDQFNKMRVADNERYPLHFKYKDKKYILKIYEDGKI